MVLFTGATNGHLAVKPRARTEHVTATVKTEAHTTSPSFGEALNVDVFKSAVHLESAMQARLAQMPSRHQKLERAFDFQSGFSPKLERPPFFFDIVGGRNRDQHSEQQHVYGVRDRDREEDAQEQNKRMRVHDADEMPPLLSPGRHTETPCLSLMGESSVPGPNYGEPNYSGNGSVSLMAPEHRSLTRSPSSGNALDEPSPLGLTLKKTPSLVDLIVMQLRSDESSPNADSIAAEAAKIRPSAKCLVPSATAQDKLKASNFPASSLKVGTWERTSRYEGDLVGKCYYAKRKLVWEVLENGLKSKIEIQWSDISAMKASCPENLPGTLEIEVSRPPLFFRETNPQPRKHTLWQTASDFTGGQATICKRHSLQFPEGVLNRHYEKLVQCDPRLKALAEGAAFTKPMPDFLDINSMAWMLDAKRQFQHLPAAHQPIGGHHDGGPDENACDLPIPNSRHLHSLLGTGLLHAGALLSDPKSEVKLSKTQPTDLSSSSPGMDSRGNSGDSGTTSDTDDMRVQDDFAEYGIDLQYPTQTSSLPYDELCEVKPSYKNLYMLGGTTSPQDLRLQEISQGLTDDIGGSNGNVIANCGGARHSGPLSSGLVEESLLPPLPLRWDAGHPFSHAPVVKTEVTEAEELGWPFSYCPPNDRLFAENSLLTSSFNKAHASESDLLVTMPRVPSVQFMNTLPPQVVYEMQHARPTYRSHDKLR